ncbi:hypothetical protein vBAbaPP1_21 [Acinetobacter phage vB_AbaM_P1]|nr:hypothetical protein vBAbaPP1_21 [Acinetobacter phage vB_AbaM_P1]WAX22678.1 hypothetical protein [Acinetobacter phage vB_AbaP_HB01]
MGYSIGQSKFEGRYRFIGYSVEAYCDQEGCNNVINRGMDYQCGDCQGYFCYDCLSTHGKVEIELDEEWKHEFGEASSGCTHNGVWKDHHPDFLRHLLTDESWASWRVEHQYDELKDMRKQYKDHLMNCGTKQAGIFDVSYEEDAVSLGYNRSGLSLDIDLDLSNVRELHEKLTNMLLITNTLDEDGNFV